MELEKIHSDSLQTTDSTGTVKLVFREYQHDFGKVAEGEKLSYIFTFDNKGTADLIISSATTTCGCTVPKYDTKPIPPEPAEILKLFLTLQEETECRQKP